MQRIRSWRLCRVKAKKCRESWRWEIVLPLLRLMQREALEFRTTIPLPSKPAAANYERVRFFEMRDYPCPGLAVFRLLRFQNLRCREFPFLACSSRFRFRPARA